MPIARALLSVSDKSGLLDFAKGLAALGVAPGPAEGTVAAGTGRSVTVGGAGTGAAVQAARHRAIPINQGFIASDYNARAAPAAT